MLVEELAHQFVGRAVRVDADVVRNTGGKDNRRLSAPNFNRSLLGSEQPLHRGETIGGKCRRGASESSFASGRREGVGLKNVEERLRGYYGDDASLTTESRPGSGTAVDLRLPVYKDGRPGRRSETVASSP